MDERRRPHQRGLGASAHGLGGPAELLGESPLGERQRPVCGGEVDLRRVGCRVAPQAPGGDAEGVALLQPDAEGCRGEIARFKVPRYVRFVDAFPMTVTGKVQKYKMREQAIELLGLQEAATVDTA